MKGDKNRGEILFDKMAYNVEFQKAIRELRGKFNIPADGFSDIKGVFSWYSGQLGLKQDLDNFTKHVSAVLNKQALPNNEWWKQKILEHILANGKFSFLPRRICPVNPFVEVSKRITNKSGAYTDLRIYEGISQREIIEYIKRNWTKLKPSYRVGTAKIVQPERDPERGRRIVEIWSKPRKELGPDNVTKEILIKRQIEKEFGKSPEFEAIKMRAHRKRHSKR